MRRGTKGPARMSEDERGAEGGRPDWLRHHGDDLSRLLSLSDGVFAFAFTLLVLQLTVPVIDTSGLSDGQISQRLAGALGGEVPAILAFALGTIFIGLQWVVHHRTFRDIRRYDPILLWLNLGFLATVAINPFLLGVFIRYPTTSAAVMLYGGARRSPSDCSRSSGGMRPGIGAASTRRWAPA